MRYTVCPAACCYVLCVHWVFTHAMIGRSQEALSTHDATMMMMRHALLTGMRSREDDVVELNVYVKLYSASE